MAKKRKAEPGYRWFRVSKARFSPDHAEFEVPMDESAGNIEQAAHDAIAQNMDWLLEEIDGLDGNVIGECQTEDEDVD